MAARRVNEPKVPESRRPPATTPEGRENQLIALAVDTVEKRIRSGEASAQELTHYLKLGSSRERLEQQRLVMEVELMAAKKSAIDEAGEMKTLINDALQAFRSYSGQEPGSSEAYDA